MENRLPLPGLLLLLLTAVGGGVLTGLVMFLASTIGHFAIISALFFALVAGIAMALMVKYATVRHKPVVRVMGLLMAIVIYGTYHYAHYLDFQHWARDEILSYEPAATDEQIKIAADAFLKEETDSEGFIGFMKFQAQVSGFTSQTNRALDLEGTTMGREIWGYWLIEMALLIFVIVGFAQLDMDTPFCADEMKWVKYQRVGAVWENYIQTFLQKLDEGNIEEAAQLIRYDPGSGDRLVIQVAYCTGEATAYLTVDFYQQKNSKRILSNTPISLEDYHIFRSV